LVPSLAPSTDPANRLRRVRLADHQGAEWPKSPDQPQLKHSQQRRISFAFAAVDTSPGTLGNRGSTDCKHPSDPGTFALQIEASREQQLRRESRGQGSLRARDSGIHSEARDLAPPTLSFLASRCMCFRSDQPHLTRIQRLKTTGHNRNFVVRHRDDLRLARPSKLSRVFPMPYRNFILACCSVIPSHFAISFHE
jgi:hypothetical protein